MAGKHILLLGAGHAPLHVIRGAALLTGDGHEVTVLAPGSFWYSGLATGMVGGAYSPRDDQVDVTALAAKADASVVHGTVAAWNPAARSVTLEDGRTIPYDIVSVNLGSFPPQIPGEDAAGCYRVKPIAELARMRADLEARFRRRTEPVRVVVAGGGATGAELAANIVALAEGAGAQAALTVVTGRGGFLLQLPDGGRRAVVRLLRRRGVQIQSGARVSHVSEGRAVLEGGGAIPFNVFLNAAGLKPSPLMRDSGLPVDERGSLRVDAHLRSIADPNVFGAGDCIALEGHDLPRIGVYAVRQAPVLLANLRAAASGDPSQTFRPQKTYLWIMNLGDGTGLASRGRLWWHGRAAFRLKDWIDRRFLAEYR